MRAQIEITTHNKWRALYDVPNRFNGPAKFRSLRKSGDGSIRIHRSAGRVLDRSIRQIENVCWGKRFLLFPDRFFRPVFPHVERIFHAIEYGLWLLQLFDYSQSRSGMKKGVCVRRN